MALPTLQPKCRKTTQVSTASVHVQLVTLLLIVVDKVDNKLVRTSLVTWRGSGSMCWGISAEGEVAK